MTDYIESKLVVRDFYQALGRAHNETQSHKLAEIISAHVAPDYFWRGMHPFYELQGAAEVAEVFWQPLKASFTNLQRRVDLFMAGSNTVDGGASEWVCSMGQLMGLLDQPWLGIPATRKMSFIRYAEFHRVKDGKIHETALFIDIIGVMKQAGVCPLPVQTGVDIVIPGPMTHSGLMYTPQDQQATEKTLRLINHMCDDLVGSGMSSPLDELHNTWHDDMIWWGPAGIGSTYTCRRYEEQHQGPFNEGLSDIVFNGHVARFAEGDFGAWFGWPNLTMTPSGGFLGLPGSNQRVDMRVVDIYRRDGDKLAENWVFIDLLYFLAQQDIDVLARCEQIYRRY